jgi:hypothetical protein
MLQQKPNAVTVIIPKTIPDNKGSTIYFIFNFNVNIDFFLYNYTVTNLNYKFKII